MNSTICEASSSLWKSDIFSRFRVHLKHDTKEEHIGYVQFWTAGKGVNCGLHDHSDLKGENAFCEVTQELLNECDKGALWNA